MNIQGETNTPQSHPSSLLAGLRTCFADGRTHDSKWRKTQLRQLRRLLTEKHEEISRALAEDLGKSPFDSYTSEIALVTHEIDYALKHLDRWMRPRKVRTPVLSLPGKSVIYSQPYGVALILAPWNYPVQLSLVPLVGALAAGNCVCLKPSELAPHTSACLARLLPAYVDAEAVRVVEGDAQCAQGLTDSGFDSIFFTGSTGVGRAVMASAAKHLTPVTLELGGKSPCIVDASARLDVTARRIVWGKFMNAGQTCIAPDYVLVHSTMEDRLLGGMAAAISDFYGGDPRQSRDYSRIINDRHFERLERLLASGQVVMGGDVDRGTRYMAPTVLRNVSIDSPVMQEEIFGPILPVLKFDGMDDVWSTLAQNPEPLALYLFAEDKHVQKRVLQATSSGSVCINDTILQSANPRLPFGGIGASGMGAYHGKASFDTFSHRRSVLRRSTRFDVDSRYPPYSLRVRTWLKRFL